MNMETSVVTLRVLTPSEGMVITDKETQTMRSKEVYLGKEDSEDNYMEIDENTPLPEPESPVAEADPDGVPNTIPAEAVDVTEPEDSNEGSTEPNDGEEDTTEEE